MLSLGSKRSQKNESPTSDLPNHDLLKNPDLLKEWP